MATVRLACLSLACSWLVAGAVAAQHPPLVPNSQHYGERNPSAARGRSGTAVVSTRALASGRTGQVTLEAATGALDGGWPYPSGIFAGLQLQTLQDNGRVDHTFNLAEGLGGSTLLSDHMPAVYGQHYQVLARVRAADGSRTDVVATSGVVRRRPDLTIHFMGPARAPVAATVNITAIVENLGTDVGATADCRLYVGDATEAADEAPAIWIDGGDSVSCVFSHIFDTVGAQPIRVAVEHVVPADDSLDNNQVSGVVQVWENPTPEVSFSLVKSRTSNTLHQRTQGHVTYQARSPGQPSPWGEDWDTTHDVEQAIGESTYLQMTSATFLTFPIASLEATFASAGAVVASMQGADLAPDESYTDGNSSYAYLSRYDDATRVTVYVQTGSDGSRSTSTYLSAERYAGLATYWASGYRHSWWSWLPDQDQYEYFTPGSSSVGVLSSQPDEDVELRIVDAAGRTFAGGGTVALQGQSTSMELPWTCNTISGMSWSYTFSGYGCMEFQQTTLTESGETSGVSGGY